MYVNYPQNGGKIFNLELFKMYLHTIQDRLLLKKDFF